MPPSIRIQAEELLHYLREFWNTHKSWVTINMFRKLLEERNGLKMCWYTVERKFYELERETLVENIKVYGYGSSGYTLVWRPTEI